jgi:polyferredoxin
MLLISLLLFPLVLFYLSPALPLMGLAKGIISGALIFFFMLFVISLFFGRLFCGWLCPAGGLQEACFSVNKNPFTRKRARNIKYILWLGLLGFSAFLIIKANSLKVDFFFQTYKGISVHKPFHYIIYYAVVFIIAFASLFLSKRSFCNTLCWMAPFMITGSALRRLLRLPSLYLKADKEKCVDCKLCNSACPMSLDVHSMVGDKSFYNSECIYCGECVSVCNKDVISFKFGIEKH